MYTLHCFNTVTCVLSLIQWILKNCGKSTHEKYSSLNWLHKREHVTWYHSKQELHIILWSCWSASFEQTVQMYKGLIEWWL